MTDGPNVHKNTITHVNQYLTSAHHHDLSDGMTLRFPLQIIFESHQYDRLDRIRLDTIYEKNQYLHPVYSYYSSWARIQYNRHLIPLVLLIHSLNPIHSQCASGIDCATLQTQIGSGKNAVLYVCQASICDTYVHRIMHVKNRRKQFGSLFCFGNFSCFAFAGTKTTRAFNAFCRIFLGILFSLPDFTHLTASSIEQNVGSRLIGWLGSGEYV